MSRSFRRIIFRLVCAVGWVLLPASPVNSMFYIYPPFSLGTTLQLHVESWGDHTQDEPGEGLA